MKIVSKIKEKLSGLKILPKFSGFGVNKSFSLLVGAILIVMMIVWMLCGRFIFGVGNGSRVSAALENGQRLEISLTTGDIKGKVLKSEASEENEKEPEEKAAPANKKPDKKIAQKDEKKPADEAGKANQPDWVTKDFIGPKMPDDLIQSLLDGGDSGGDIAVASVSIKDISEKPVVVIIIKGMGLSSSSTREALELPKEVTMGFSPYSPSLDIWMKQVAESGHEIILNVPMETGDYHTDNPGPYALLTDSSEEDNATRLKMLLSLTKGYSAIYTENTEVFTRSSSNLKPILEQLKKENKYLVYGGGYSNYSMIQVADSINYPILVSDLVLDDDISATAINDKLKEMEKIATDKGYVVVMAHPYPITIRMLKGWMAKVPEKDLVVSPVSLLLGKVFK
jgi:polysaccharide deacetylase 2 family uncharacterized protein YibQ